MATRTFRRWPILALLVGALAGPGGLATARPAEAASYAVRFADGRYYTAHKPSRYTGIAVIALHQRGGTWQDMARYWSRLSDRYGFLAVYPQASPDRSWNAGRCCPAATTTMPRDDTAFLDRVQRDIRSRFGVRTVRFFGYSNGGMLALASVCERPWMAARVAVVASGPTTLRSSCSWSGSAMVMHPRNDEHVPLLGGYREWCACTFRSLYTTPSLYPRARIAGVLLPGGHSSGWDVAATYDRAARHLIA